MKFLFLILLYFAFMRSYCMAKNFDVGIQSVPEICRNQNGVLIHMPGSCTGFYICVNGHAIASSCGGFYHFNARTGLCDHPLKAACASNDAIIRNTLPAITRLVPRPSLPKPKNPNEVIADLSAGPICENLPTGVLLPKWNSCTQYYVCIYQRPYQRTCPPMLHFNATRGLCQDPTMAQCVIALEDLSKPRIQPNKTKAVADSKEDRLENADVLGAVDNVNVDGICAMSSDGTLLSYPGDCSRFIFCMQHQTLTIFCPQGHHFSRRHGRCEWPSIAQCATLVKALG